MLARVFAEPLLPTGATSVEENRALAKALVAYVDAHRADDTTAVELFLALYPQSSWRASLWANPGAVFIGSGYLSCALQAWDDAWALTKEATSGPAKSIADHALGEWLDLRTRLGHVDEAAERLSAIEGRMLLGPVTAKVRLARDRVAMMRNQAEERTSPGIFAIAAAMDPEGRITDEAWRRARQAEPRPRSSLLVLRRLARAVRVPLALVRPEPGAGPTAPVIVQWRAGHVAAVVQQDGDRFLVRDAQSWQGRWISRHALETESTGVYLARASDVGATWTPAAAATAAAAQGWQSTCPPGAPDTDDPCNDKCCTATGAGGGPGSGGGGGWGDGPAACSSGRCGPTGMPEYTIHPVTAGLRLHDIPVGHAVPRGPDPRFLVRYNQDDQRQPNTFFYSNLGPKWTTRWIAFVYEFGGGDDIDIYLPGSGLESYMFRDANGVYNRHWRSRALVVRTSVDPIRYERRLPDGSVEVYARPDGPAPSGRRVFLTAFVDPQGQSVELTWDSSLRIVAATDALGQVTTVSYEHPTDPLKITKVTDPFGRFATFEYDDLGRLVAITDVLGLTSRMGYDRDDLVGSLTTPYGTTTFRRESISEGPLNRWLEATDPLGGVERVEYRYLATPGVSATAPAAEVPAGVLVSNQHLDRFNTYYWSKRAMALHPRQHDKAVVTHWLFGNSGRTTDPAPAVSVPHSVKHPLESRIWYRYQGQAETISSAQGVGDGSQPSVTARVLDDGSTQVWRATYNEAGKVTSKTDPAGRRTSYTYAANGIDLTEVRQTTGSLNDLLATYGDYTAGHLPQTMTDAAGETTSMTYTAAGQVLTITNAKSETTTYAYDGGGLGYLQSVTGPVSGATTSYTYDGYGRVRTVTDSDGYTLTTDYDVFDRPTKTTYPDSTFEETIYDRLDPVRRRDRLGRWSYTTYDALRRATSTRDPLGRVVRQEWCACGTLDALVDAKNQKTTWQRDLQGRVTAEVRADGTTTTSHTYETTTSRLKTVTDPKGQVATHSYALDDSLLGTTWTNAAIATPSVSYTYDPNYPRVATMVDGIGTTAYTYHPPGTAGAGQLATVDGPLTNDTLSYEYDELGRVVERSINGAANTLTLAYDVLGRVTTETNVLGMFTYGYDGVTNRLSSVLYPNGQTSAYGYYPNSQDHRLQTIHHKYPGGATLSKFDYTYDVAGNILTWQQQADSDPPVLWVYGYDRADQLTRAVKQTTGGSPTVLKRYAYGYDLAGNRTFEQIDDAVTGWTHDSLNRLVTQYGGGELRFAGTVSERATVTINGVPAPVTATNVFEASVPVATGTPVVTIAATDPNGNTATAAYEVDVAANGKTFTYDANGNLTSDGARTFEWDARNQLVAATGGTRRSEFTYGGSQRRVRVVEIENGVPQSDEQVLWCVTEICEERSTNGNSVFRRLFRHGEHSATTSRYFAADHLRSVRRVTDGTASLLAAYDHDPWGRRTPSDGTSSTKVGFTGHEWHENLEVWLAPHRLYSSGLARWLSEDPSRALTRTRSWADYVENRPTVFVDPLGLQGMAAAVGLPNYCEVHRNRNRYNRCPKKRPANWTTVWLGSKDRLPDGSECAFDECGNLLPDKDGNYTFNFEPNPTNPAHIFLDVLPHFVCGQSYTQNLTTVY